jgi:ureidoglycolate lyase
MHDLTPQRSGRVIARLLSPAAFAEYGEVIAAEGSHAIAVNEGRALRYDALTRLGHSTSASAPALALYRVSPSSLPFKASLFERHPYSSQVFLPMTGGVILTAVAPDRGGAPDAERIQAFISPGGMGIHYRAGVWHLPIAALGSEVTLAMLMWEGSHGDTEEHRLAQPILIEK